MFRSAAESQLSAMKAAKKLKSKFGGGGMASKFKKKPAAAANPAAAAPQPDK